MRYTRRIMHAAPLAGFNPQEWKPGPRLEYDDELLRAAGDLGMTTFHPVGSCKMGHDGMAVVDDRLAVHGPDDVAGTLRRARRHVLHRRK